MVCASGVSMTRTDNNGSSQPCKHIGMVGIDQEDCISQSDSIPPTQNFRAFPLPSGCQGITFVHVSKRTRYTWDCPNCNFHNEYPLFSDPDSVTCSCGEEYPVKW